MFNKITEQIIAALESNEDGGTYAMDNGSLPSDGYMIGGLVPSLINPTASQIAEFVESNSAQYVGFWKDADGTVYVDAVSYTSDERFARRLSALRNEIAFWDVSNSQEVRV
jgi:hypothetical protein